jgi:hypothetical protein
MDAARADTFCNLRPRNVAVHAGQSPYNLSMPRDWGEIVASRLCYNLTMWRDLRAFNLASQCSEHLS